MIVQARTSSRRLKGKVLMPIEGEPMVLHVLRRASAIGPPVILATSTDASDDELASSVSDAGFEVTRGPLHDVLDRFMTSIPAGAVTVMRITADCPLFDPLIGRAVLAIAAECPVDYVSNSAPATFPDGLDCEVLTVQALRRAWREATEPSDREHVTSYVRMRPDVFRVLGLTHTPDLSAERWTVDDEADLGFVRAIYRALADVPPSRRTSMYSVLELLEQRPDLRPLRPS